jgi:hypothetical protein
MPTADLAIFTVVYTTVVLVAHMGPQTMHGIAGGVLSLWVLYRVATGATAELGSAWTPGARAGTPDADRDEAIGFFAVVLVMGMCATTSALCAVSAHRGSRAVATRRAALRLELTAYLGGAFQRRRRRRRNRHYQTPPGNATAPTSDAELRPPRTIATSRPHPSFPMYQVGELPSLRNRTTASTHGGGGGGGGAYRLMEHVEMLMDDGGVTVDSEGERWMTGKSSSVSPLSTPAAGAAGERRNRRYGSPQHGHGNGRPPDLPPDAALVANLATPIRINADATATWEDEKDMTREEARYLAAVHCRVPDQSAYLFELIATVLPWGLLGRQEENSHVMAIAVAIHVVMGALHESEDEWLLRLLLFTIPAVTVATVTLTAASILRIFVPPLTAVVLTHALTRFVIVPQNSVCRSRW